MSNLSAEGELYGFIDANNNIIDYNVLTNRPKINNKTIEGKHNGRYYGLTESEIIDWIDYQALPEETKKNGKVYYIRNVGTYEEKTISNVAIASFNDGSSNPLMTLKNEIVPYQEGTGTPSPSNPRPISGWSSVEIHVADGETPHIIDNVTNVSLGQTVYGGELDVTSGVLTVDRIGYKLDELDWAFYNSNYFRTAVIDALVPGTNDVVSTAMCSIYKSTAPNNIVDKTINVATNKRIVIKDDDYATKEAFVASLTGIYAYCNIATPTTVQLTPTQITTLLGANNIWTNTGNIIKLKYLSPTGNIENQIRTNDEIFGTT